MKIYFLENILRNINKNNNNYKILSNNSKQEVVIFNNKCNNKYKEVIKS